MLERGKERERGEREGGKKREKGQWRGEGEERKRREGAGREEERGREELRQFRENPKRNKTKIQKSRVLAIPFTTWRDSSGSAGGAKSSPLWGSPGYEWILCF